jgi:hypothetical protein
MKEQVQAGMMQAAQSGACDYFKQHPEVVYDLRKL